MTTNVTRNFIHRTHGKIGHAALSVDSKGKWMLDGKELPLVSAEYLANFALQSLQDAYAGAKDGTEAVAAFEKKRDSLIAGTIGTRGGGDGVTELQAASRAVARRLLKAQAGKEAWQKFADLEAGEQNEKLDAIVEANRAAIEKLAQADIDERKRRAEAAKAAAAAITIEL